MSKRNNNNSTSPAIFEWDEFNYLPRYEINNKIPIGDKSFSFSFARAFPFLFKPNRALALHSQKLEDGIISGHPSRDPKGRRLILLKMPSHLKKVHYVVMISRDGSFCLWNYHYESSGASDSGLFPVGLIDKSGDKSKIYKSKPSNCFSLNVENPLVQRNVSGFKRMEFVDRLPYNFNLIRYVQSADPDGIVFIRLVTPRTIHRIELDFNIKKHTDNIQYRHIMEELDVVEGEDFDSLRQIGGWKGDVPFYWRVNEVENRGKTDFKQNNQLFYGGFVDRGGIQLPESFSTVRLRAAASKNGFLALGGDAERLLVRKSEKDKLKPTPLEAAIRGFVRALEVVPEEIAPKHRPLILVGCDDHYLYILDKDCHQIQKVNMGSSIEDILFLHGKKNKWFDLLIIVRRRGLYCGRIFLDKFRRRGQPDRAEHDILDKIYKKLQKDPSLLVRWAESKESDEQLLAVSSIIHSPAVAGHRWFSPDHTLLSRLDGNIISYITHILHRKIRTLIRDPVRVKHSTIALDNYLGLLNFMVVGPYHARVAVRSLEGILSQLQPTLDTIHSKQIDDLLDALPDAKRNIWQLAAKIVTDLEHGEKRQAIKNTGSLMALDQRLSQERMYNELIILPPGEAGRADALTMKGWGASKDAAQIFNRRGEERLCTFCLDAKPARVKVDETRDWLQNLPKNKNKATHQPIVRALIPIFEDCLFVVTNHKYGIAAKKVSEISWLGDSTSPLWSAARLQYSPDNALLVVAGEYLPFQNNSPFQFFLDSRKGGITEEKIDIYMPHWWKNQVRINKIVWDSYGGLWAVTAGSGELVYWAVKKQSKSSFPVFGDPSWKGCIGSPQHALAILEPDNKQDELSWRIVSGGQDGVLRAFDYDGQLKWTFLVPGNIHAITALSDLKGDCYKQFSRLAVITDSHHIFLLDDNGHQEGILELAGRFPTALFSRQLKTDGAVHHLIGMMRGEIRLVEEMPLDWKAIDYLNEDGFRRFFENPDSVDVERIKDNLETIIGELQKDKYQLSQWCQLENALHEPLRAAWASRMLLEQSSPDFETVVDLLIKTSDRKDFPIRFMRSHIFAALGKINHKVPKQFIKPLIELAHKSKDGAVAAMLDAVDIPENPEYMSPFLKGMFLVVTKKISLGLPFTSSAVLNLLRNLPKAYDYYIDLLLLYVFKEGSIHQNQIHFGFVEGLLANLFNRLDTQDRGSLLTQLPRLNMLYPEFSKKLSYKPEFAKAVRKRLSLYSGALCSECSYSIWKATLPVLAVKPFELRTALIKAVYKLEDSLTPSNCNETTKPKDLTTLQNFLTFFPQHVGNLEKIDGSEGWSTLWEKSRELRTGILMIERQIFSQEEAKNWVERQKKELRQLDSQLPLLEELQNAWKESWIRAMERVSEREHNLKDVVASSDMAIGSVVELVFQFLDSLGFKGGRFYRVVKFPGRVQVLELSQANKNIMRKESKLPVRCILPTQLIKRLHEYSQITTKTKHDLLYGLRRHAEFKNDPSITFWCNYLKIAHRNHFLELPILKMDKNKNKFETIAFFIFDFYQSEEQSGPKDLKFFNNQLNNVKEILIHLLGMVNHSLIREEKKYHDHLLDTMADLDTVMYTSRDRTALEDTILKKAIDLTGASGGLLVSREGAADYLVPRAIRGKKEKEYYKKSVFPFQLQNSLVVKCWKTGKPSYLPDYASSYAYEDFCKKDLSHINAHDHVGFRKWRINCVKGLVVVPIGSGDQIVGSISLHFTKPFAFNSQHHKALQMLTRRARWFLYAAKLEDERTSGARAFIHEMRSELARLKRFGTFETSI
ncbi:MAG: GAF domain-containing protein [Magnetococcales bacterium]|nr:GAF domain-containing protein [Magnetococcales bacterium]